MCYFLFLYRKMLCHHRQCSQCCSLHVHLLNSTSFCFLKHYLLKQQLVRVMTGDYNKKSTFQSRSLNPAIGWWWYSLSAFAFFFRLLIGAPRARALGKQTANITGGLYKCEMSLSTDCERIEFDNEGERYICVSSNIVSKPMNEFHCSCCCFVAFRKRTYVQRTRRTSGWGWLFRARDLGER